MKKQQSEYQSIKECLINTNPKMAEQVRIDPDLPAVTRADLFLVFCDAGIM